MADKAAQNGVTMYREKKKIFTCKRGGREKLQEITAKKIGQKKYKAKVSLSSCFRD